MSEPTGSASAVTVGTEPAMGATGGSAAAADVQARAPPALSFGMHLIPVEGLAEGATVEVGAAVEVVEVDDERRAEWERLFGFGQ